MSYAKTCDACGRDISFTGNCVGYTIAVGSRSMPIRGGIVTAVHVEPPFKEPLDFCGHQCFSDYFRDRLVPPRPAPQESAKPVNPTGLTFQPRDPATYTSLG